MSAEWSLGSNSIWLYHGGSSFADTKEGRYNPKMHPVIPVHNWRKGSQVLLFSASSVLKLAVYWFLELSVMSSLSNCYFSSQWAVLTRKHAIAVVRDDMIYPLFHLHCKVIQF